MSLYNIVDHRAPVWFPHKAETHMNDAIIWMPVLIGGMTALFVGTVITALGFWYLALVIPFLVLCWYKYMRRWIYAVPDEGDRYMFADHFERMLKLYRANPHAQEALEPMLTQCYKYIPTLDTAAVKKRSRLMQQYIDENPPVASPVIEDNSDIEDFKNIMQIRREMKREGLL